MYVIRKATATVDRHELQDTNTTAITNNVSSFLLLLSQATNRSAAMIRAQTG